jgi:aflatoxin B1 aldehyde reductase
LAGGFLTGKLTRGDVNGTRFADGNLAGMMYKPMYDKIEMHAAIRQLEGKIKTHHLTMTETGLRWIFYHAALHEGDGVILGASKPAYIEQNMAEIARGPLPDDVVATIEEVWEAVKRGSP